MPSPYWVGITAGREWERATVEVIGDFNTGVGKHRGGQVEDRVSFERLAFGHAGTGHDEEGTLGVRTAPGVLRPDFQLAEARGLDGVPLEVGLPVNGQVGELFGELAVVLLLQTRDGANHATAGDGIGQFFESSGNVVKQLLVFGAGFDEAAFVPAFDSDADGAGDLVVGNSEGAAPVILATARVPEEKKLILPGAREAILDEVLKPGRHDHLEDAPGVDAALLLAL